MYRIALVSREVFPFPPTAGLGAYITATANALVEDAEVTIITTDMHEKLCHKLRAAGSPLLPRDGVRLVFVADPKPEESDGYFDPRHLWSDRAFQKLKELYPDGGPEIVEFPDYLGEGAVTVQAVNTLDRALRNTLVCIRLHTTREMIDVLNGHVPQHPPFRVAADLERYALAHADRILWAGGDILETYKRFYGRALAPSARIRHAVLPMPAPPPKQGDSKLSEALHFLYLGRFEPRKGVQNLLRAVTGLSSENWRLTLAGGDTKTGSLGTSIRTQLELSAADDPRITFRQHVTRDDVFDLFASHDVVVTPSLWECWPTLVLEAMSQSQPVLATPVGGYTEMVCPGRSGWLTADTGDEALANSLEYLLEHRDEVAAIAGRGASRQMFEELTNVDSVREGYAELAAQSAREQPARRQSSPLVSVIVPYFEVDEYVEATIESIFGQTYRRLEVVVVNDGSFRPQDRVLNDLARRFPLAVYTQQNSGLGRARNFAISQSRGKYVLTLDPDDVLEPTFAERCVDVLETRPDVSYVNCWVRYVNEENQQWGPPSHGYRPFSNEGLSLEVLNSAGSATALFRRRVFELGHWYSSAAAPSYEDWLLYRELAAANLFGHTIPELLLRYRIRSKSMARELGRPNSVRLIGEMETHLRAKEMQWTS
jgi:glycogen(starch) synthase